MNEIAVVIHTCDKYSFIWKRLINSLIKYFPSNYPIYMCNEEGDIDLPDRIIQIKTGINKWSNRLQIALNEIQTKNTIYFQEDFILDRIVDEELLKKCIEFHDQNNNDITKLGNFFEFEVEYIDIFETYPLYLQYETSPYIISHQPIAIWNTEYLLSTLTSINTQWEHEVFISKKINSYQKSCKCYCIGSAYNPNKSDIISYIHAVRNGVEVA